MIDARNFTEICKGLTQDEWLRMRDSLVKATMVKETTIYRWRDGKQSPNKLTQAKVASILRREFKLNVSALSLFD